MSIPRPSKKVLDDLRQVATSTLTGVLGKLYGSCDPFFLEHLKPASGDLVPNNNLVGPARTIQYEEIPTGMMDLLNVKRADDIIWETMEPGDVVVNSTLGHTEWGHYGDLVCFNFKNKGGAGLITDGVLRDLPYIRQTGWKVFTLNGGSNPAGRGSRTTHVQIFPRHHDVPICCDGCTVRPGDIIVGDGEGVIVIPIEIAEKVAELGLATEKIEDLCREKALEGIFTHPIEWKYIVEAGLTREAEISGYRTFVQRKERASKAKG